MIPSFLNPNPPREVPAPGNAGDVLTVENDEWVSKANPSSAGVVSESYSLTASVQEVVLPEGIAGDFIHQVFQVVGTDEIHMPNLQLYYNTSDSKWYIDLSGYEAMTVKIMFIS